MRDVATYESDVELMEDNDMNWNQLEVSWILMRNRARGFWGKLTENHFETPKERKQDLGNSHSQYSEKSEDNDKESSVSTHNTIDREQGLKFSNI